MIKLIPIEETQAGKDLIQMGYEEGRAVLLESYLTRMDPHVVILRDMLQIGYLRGTYQAILLALLQIRFHPVPPDIQAAIDGITDPARLHALHLRALAVRSLDEWRAALDE